MTKEFFDRDADETDDGIKVVSVSKEWLEQNLGITDIANLPNWFKANVNYTESDNGKLLIQQSNEDGDTKVADEKLAEKIDKLDEKVQKLSDSIDEDGNQKVKQYGNIVTVERYDISVPADSTVDVVLDLVDEFGFYPSKWGFSARPSSNLSTDAMVKFAAIGLQETVSTTRGDEEEFTYARFNYQVRTNQVNIFGPKILMRITNNDADTDINHDSSYPLIIWGVR